MNNDLYNTNYIPTHAMNNYQGKYVEEYLTKNINKNIEAHVSFCDSIEWRDTVFKGILEDVGKDYLVIKSNNNSYVIWSIYIDYIIILNN